MESMGTLCVTFTPASRLAVPPMIRLGESGVTHSGCSRSAALRLCMSRSYS